MPKVIVERILININQGMSEVGGKWVGSVVMGQKIGVRDIATKATRPATMKNFLCMLNILS